MEEEVQKLQDKKILLVEEDSAKTRFWERCLKESGEHVHHITSSFEEAKHLLEENSYDLLISEVNLKDKHGFELSRLAKSKNPNIEVVFTTSYKTDFSRYHLSDSHFHFLQQPFANVSEIAQFISRLLHGKNVYDSAPEDSFSEDEFYPEVIRWKL